MIWGIASLKAETWGTCEVFVLTETVLPVGGYGE